ncbi:hypothetical protein [Streptomyces zaomyceticus]|uniref:hypothetical protein n=1 Tax=Streptomyces zaomyceticus TaxID=68286 RepID=UPI003796C1CD
MRENGLRQLRRLLLSREGGGTVLMAGATAIALGVVPSVLEQWTSEVWVYLLVFAAGLGTVVAGWLIRRPKGLGVVLSLYPPERTQRSRVGVFKAASRSSHSTTLVIDRAVLWPALQGGRVPASVVDLAARLIDAQVEELRESSQGEADVVLYALAHLSDGFLLGRRLAADPQLSLSLMHLSHRQGRSVMLGLRLGHELREPLSSGQQSLVATYLDGTAGPAPQLVEVAASSSQTRHRVAVIVRLTAMDSMTDEAIRTVTAHSLGAASHQQGYELDGGEDPSERGFGAYVVVEVSGAGLPDDPAVFTAVTKHLHHVWRDARREWTHRVGTEVPVEGRLFFHGPLPIAMALGWLWGGERVDMMHH